MKIYREADISVVTGGLRVGNRSLRADVLPRKDGFEHVDPEALEGVLLMGRRAIVSALDEIYAQSKARHPDLTVVRGSIWTAQLGNAGETDGRNSRVYSQAGYDNGGIHYSKYEQKPAFWDYWEAIEHAGFYPEVRGASGSNGGAWLCLRDVQD